MKHFALCALGLFISPCLITQEIDKTLVNDLIKHWQKSKRLALDVAQTMPGDGYSLKLPGRQASFADQLGGLALGNVLSCSLALHTAAPGRFQSAFDRPMDSSKAGVTQSLSAAYDYCIAGLEQTNDAALFDTAVSKGQKLIKLDIFLEAFGRAAHSLGQADIYLRLKGLTPPDTGPKYDF